MSENPLDRLGRTIDEWVREEASRPQPDPPPWAPLWQWGLAVLVYVASLVALGLFMRHPH